MGNLKSIWRLLGVVFIYAVTLPVVQVMFREGPSVHFSGVQTCVRFGRSHYRSHHFAHSPVFQIYVSGSQLFCITLLNQVRVPFLSTVSFLIAANCEFVFPLDFLFQSRHAHSFILAEKNFNTLRDIIMSINLAFLIVVSSASLCRSCYVFPKGKLPLVTSLNSCQLMHYTL